MTPGVGRGLSDEQKLEKQIERQMGCMAGFLQIFDRQQILAGKRYYASKRLPTSPATGSTSPSERSEASVSPLYMKESRPPPSPEAYPSSPESRAPADAPARPSLPLPVFEFKDGLRSSWKLREAPRLSLDSRAIVDAKGKLRPREIRTSGNQPDASEAGEDLDKQRRSPSVVARLMGLEALPNADDGGEPVKRAQLRRSASESRVPRDLSHYRFVDLNTFQKQSPPDASMMSGEFFRYRAPYSKAEIGGRDSKPFPTPRVPLAASLQRKSFFDAQDFFPEPKRTGSLYGEIERRLRMRGIDEPAKDLETLKQILEALQLKGLLHSKFPPGNHQINGLRRSNLVLEDRHARSISGDSPIIVMKLASKPPRRPGSEPPPLPSRSVPPACRRAAPEAVLPARARRHQVEMEHNPRGGRSPRSPDRTEVTRSPSSPAKRRPSNAGTPPPQRRSPAVHSPRSSPKRVVPDSLAVRSPRNRRPDDSSKGRIYLPPVEDDSSTTISESSMSSSQFDFERSRVEEYRAERSLLERCDKLLHSIAAITSSSSEQGIAADQQPSPVSVLDASSFLCDEGSSPSPALKRSIDFKDQLAEWEEDQWAATVQSLHLDGPDTAGDHDLAYVSEILRASDRNRDLSDVYVALEKRHQKAGASEASRLHRRLVCDTVAEILDRKRNLLPWDAFSRAVPAAANSGSGALLRQVWAEVRRMREQVLPAADDPNDVTCGVIRKDMVAAGDRGWGGACSEEMSDAVLHIERQIFKDLVAEAIRDLANLAGGKSRAQLPCRKLVF